MVVQLLLLLLAVLCRLRCLWLAMVALLLLRREADEPEVSCRLVAVERLPGSSCRIADFAAVAAVAAAAELVMAGNKPGMSQALYSWSTPCCCRRGC